MQHVLPVVINAYAPMVAQGIYLSDDLKAAFENFTTKVEENWLQPADREPTTPLGRAYFNFWMKYNSEN